MWSIIRADWRRFAYLTLGGWAMFAVVFIFAFQGLMREDCATCPVRTLFMLKLFVFLLAYGQAPAVLWAQLNGNHIYYRQKMLATLPLSCVRLNLIHFFTAAILLALGAVPWLATVWLWRHFDVPIEPWTMAFVLLSISCFLLLSMRNVFPRVIIPLLFVGIVLPGTENLLAGPLVTATNPISSIVLAVVTVIFASWVAQRPTPRWAPDMGGKSRAPQH